MKPIFLSRFSLACAVGLALGLTGCQKQEPAEPASTPAPEKADTTEKAGAQALSAEELQAVEDPVGRELDDFRMETRQAYNRRDFDTLEKVAAELLAKKAVFDNGYWKIVQFHGALECARNEPASMWELHDEIHRAWIAAKPQSVTALVAYGSFLTDYAWHARGTGYADTVTEEGWQLMKERLEAARKVLIQARALPDYDPYYGTAMLTVALGQEWPAMGYDMLMKDLEAKEPKFWGYQNQRAYSLLPRWYGEPGDWEKYAEKVAGAPDGLGTETYARIVLNLTGYYRNIFTETQASWPKTREGLETIMRKYPRSLWTLNSAAALATRAQDKPFAKALFAKMGATYNPQVWRNAGQVAAARAWAESP